jgi:hypothetical protein
VLSFIWVSGKFSPRDLITHLIYEKNENLVIYVCDKFNYKPDIWQLSRICENGLIRILEHIGKYISLDNIDRLLYDAIYNNHYNIFVWIYHNFDITADHINQLIAKLYSRSGTSKHISNMIEILCNVYGLYPKIRYYITEDDGYRYDYNRYAPVYLNAWIGLKSYDTYRPVCAAIYKEKYMPIWDDTLEDELDEYIYEKYSNIMV